MAKFDGRDSEAEPATGPVEMEVFISRPATARRRASPTTARRASYGAILVSVLIAAAIAGAIVASRDQRRTGVAQREPAAARDAGPAGVAAAYRHPLRCLSVSFATSDPDFARADFDRASPCGRYDGYATAIFQRVDGRWRSVLDSTSYACPVSTLPASVQKSLAVCP